MRRAALLCLLATVGAEPSTVWVRYQGLDCYGGYGARELENPVSSWCGTMSLEQCKAKCAVTKDCTGVAYDTWYQHCFRRADINIPKCTTQWGYEFDTHVAYRTGTGWSELKGRNCYDSGHGTQRLVGEEQGYPSTTLAQCQEKCQGTAGCSSIVVSLDGTDYCWMYGGNIDYNQCDDGQGVYTTIIMGSPVAPDSPSCSSPGMTPCLAGITKVGYGYHAYNGVLANAPVVATTFIKQKTFVNPGDRSTYLIPDQVVAIADQGSTTAVETHAFGDASSVGDWQSREAGLSVGIGWFSASATTQKANAALSSGGKYSYWARSTMSVSWYSAALAPPMELTVTDGFAQAVAKLPAYNSPGAMDAFQQFFDTYGTHYIESAVFGGSGGMDTSVSSSWSSSQGSSSLGASIGAQCSWHFIYLKASGGSSSATDHSDQTFQKESSFSEFFVGGQPGVYSTLSDWNKWMKTVTQHPEVITQKLRPIDTLVWDQTKAGDLRAAAQKLYNSH